MNDARLESLWGNDPPLDFEAILAEVFRDLPWMAEAECGRTLVDGSPIYDPDLWHPEKGGSVAEAKEVCEGCPVRVDCLSYAMDTKQQHGVWGGKSVMERRAMRRLRRGDPDGE